MAFSTNQSSKPFKWELFGRPSTDPLQGKGNPAARWGAEQARNAAAYNRHVAQATGRPPASSFVPSANGIMSVSPGSWKPQDLQGIDWSVTAADTSYVDPFEEFMSMFGDSGGDAAAAAAARQQAIEAINQSYQRQIDTLNANKTNAANLIQQYANQFATNLQPIQQQFEGANQASVAEIARRAAQGQAEASNLAKQLVGAMSAEGVNAQPIQQQAQINAQQASQGTQYENDLTNRLAQIAAMNQANAMSGNELVRQGAAGTLEQNYSQMLTALQNAKEQEILNAQYGGSSGGGGGGSSADPLDQMSKYLRTRQLFDQVMGGGTDYTDIQSLMGAAAQKDPASFLTAVLGMTPEQRQSFGISG